MRIGIVGAGSMSVALACYESAESGQPVRLAHTQAG
jgi:hypothetical protein